MRPAGASPSLSGSIASEKAVVEVPAVELLQSLGWQHGDLMQEEVGAKNATGRLSFREVILPARLRASLRRLNPALPKAALSEAERALTADRSAMLPVAANREVYGFLRDGVPIEVRQPDGSLKPERVVLVDWTNPTSNDFFLASQFWIESDLYKRRPDTVGFVNGIPLLLVEWKAPMQPVQEAYEANLRDYRDTIPRLFEFNGFTILHGLEALMGRATRNSKASRHGRSWMRRVPRAWRWKPSCGRPANRLASSTLSRTSCFSTMPAAGCGRWSRSIIRCSALTAPSRQSSKSARTVAVSASSGTPRAAARACPW